MTDQLDAAVKAGRLTQAQADAIAKRVRQGSIGPGWPGAAPPATGGASAPTGNGPLTAAAGYLGLTRAQLLTQLQSGKTLAQIAKARGKSTSGLQQAMVASVKSRLDQAVSAKRISSSQEQQILSTLSDQIAREINGQAPGGRFPGYPGFHRGYGYGGATGPMPGAFQGPGGAAPAGAPA